METSTSRRYLMLALLVDAGILVSLFVSLPRLGALLGSPSGMNTLLLAAVYLPFLGGTFLLRKLQPRPPATGVWLSPTVRGILAGVFGLVLTTALAWQLGFFESLSSADPRILGEGEAAAYFVFAPGAWIGVSMLYILFLAFPVNETVAPANGNYPVYALIGLVTTGAMMVTLMAQGQAMLAEGISTLWLVMGFGLLLVLFIPPRLLYASRVFPLPGRAVTISLVSLVLVIAAGSWLMVSV